MITADHVRAVVAELRKLPFLAVYVGDWVRDPVSNTSLAAQMLWMRMMFVMHDAPLYGHLCDARGKALSPDQVMQKCGVRRPSEYQKLLGELTIQGVPRLTGDVTYSDLLTATINDQEVDLSPLRTSESNVIYSKRMVADHRLRVIRKLTGELGTPSRRGLGTQKTHLGTQNADTRAGVRAEDENEIGSKKQSPKSQEGVQGEGPLPPDFEAVKRLDEMIAASVLRVAPPLQIVTAWMSEYGEELIRETLADCEAEYRGKGYQYLERILTTRRDDPSQRPSNRRNKRSFANGNGNRNVSSVHLKTPADAVTARRLSGPNAWTQIVQQIAEPSAWLRDACAIESSEDGRHLVIGVPSELHIDEIRELHRTDIKHLRRKLGLAGVEFEFTVVKFEEVS